MAMLPASEGELGVPSARSPWGQARPSASPAAAAERERQAEVGSKEGACARILQQPSKDKAERECVHAWGGGLRRAALSEAAWCHLRDTRKLALNPSEAREAEEGDNSAAPRCSQTSWHLPACKGCSGSWVSAAHLNQTHSQVKSGSLENCMTAAPAKYLLLWPAIQHG